MTTKLAIRTRQGPRLWEIDRLSTLTRAAANALELCAEAGGGFDRDAFVTVRRTAGAVRLTVSLPGALACTDLDILGTTAGNRFRHLTKERKPGSVRSKTNEQVYEATLADVEDRLLGTPFEFLRLEALESLSLGADGAEIIPYVDPPTWAGRPRPTVAERSRQERMASRIEFLPEEFLGIPDWDDGTSFSPDDTRRLAAELRGKTAPAFAKIGL